MDEQQTESVGLPHASESFFRRHFLTVTAFSKYLALILFVTLPFAGFWVGIQFVETASPSMVSIEEDATSNTHKVLTPASTKAASQGPTAKIVYTERVNGNLSLFTILSDGTDKKLIYSGTSRTNKNILEPVWADNKTIQFQAYQDGSPIGSWKYFLINDDGTGLREVDKPIVEVPLESTPLMDSRFSFSTTTENPEVYYFYFNDNGKDVLVDTIDLTKCVCMCYPEVDISYATASPANDFVMLHKDMNIEIVSLKDGSKKVIASGSRPSLRVYTGPSGKTAEPVETGDANVNGEPWGNYRVTNMDRVGYIRDAYNKSGFTYIDFDEIQFIYDDRCIDGYAIKNNDKATETLRVSNNANITFTGYNSDSVVHPDVQSFINLFVINLPYWINQSGDGEVTDIKEQYVP